MPADSPRDIDDPDRSFDDSPIVWLDRSEAFSNLSATEIIVYEYLAEEGPGPVYNSAALRPALGPQHSPGTVVALC